MKKLVITLSSVIAVYSCNKSKMQPINGELSELKSNTSLTSAKQKGEPDPKNKKADLDACPTCPACIDGNAYCLEVIVTPKFNESFRKAIDNNQVSEFLTNEVIQELGHGNGKIISDLHLVRNGIKQVRYVTFPKSANRVGFLIGGNSVSKEEYDVAIVGTNE